jgi:hypothetical protein
MAEAPLLASAAFGLLSGTLFAFVGWHVQRRTASPGVRLAGAAFTTWWYAISAVTIIGAVHTAVAAYGRATLESALLETHLALLLLCVALWGLLYYLLYLYTGWQKLWAVLAVGYVLYYAMLLYFVIASRPIGVKVDRWQVQLEYEQMLTGPFFGALIVLLLVPQILAAIAYFLLYFQTSDPSARYRIAVVSFSIILWFGLPLVGIPLHVSEEDWWQVVSRVIGVGATLAILAAYRPPAWVRSRYGIAAA